MSILWNGKGVTSLNCYKTLEKYFNCNGMLSRKFPVTMATRGHLKIAQNHYFALILLIKPDFKVLQLLKGFR
jgi:hypothetical protein